MEKIKCRSYVNYDKQKFQEDIIIIDHPGWKDFCEIEENKPTEMWDSMKNIIEEIVNSHCTFKDISMKEDTPTWRKKTGKQEDWVTFTKKKNEVKKQLATVKENYIKGKLDELDGNPRKFWREINNISGLGKNKNGRKCTKIIDENNNTHENLDAAEFLNNYYVNIGPNLAKSHNKQWVKEKCIINVETTFNFTWVTEIEVKRPVKEICITKASAIERLSSRLLRDAFEILTFHLTYIYNSCLQNVFFYPLLGNK